ncbi:MAG TPA: MBL fold metallo-hydrolase [Elusimicrobiota bacterium]|nr:MBL fold metallo-hydrolase [Elusimicrobiota bacterium]
MLVKFWGVRGSIATPGQDTVQYGGNTACVEVSDGTSLLILDAGTGIRPLGTDLITRFPKGTKINAHILLSHFHLDHILGFPFFVPAYNKNNALSIYGCEGAGKKLENVFIGQMAPEYFPVTIKEMPAEMKFVQLGTRPIEINGFKVSPTYVNHPGLTLGYRIEHGESKVAYITDHEPYRYLLRQHAGTQPIFDGIENGPEILGKEDRNLVEFVKGVDVLIHDAQYTFEEYKSHLSWGHSFYEYAIQIALEADVKNLVFFHHDPMRSDRQIHELMQYCQNFAQKKNPALKLYAAWEGLEINLP